MRSDIRRPRRLVPALAGAAAVAGVQFWGWDDAARTLTIGSGWLWQTGWSIVRVVALPLVAAGVLYVATSAASRHWWRSEPWRGAGRAVQQAWLPLAVAGIIVVLSGMVVFAPTWLVARDITAGGLTAEQRTKATSDARSALLQAVGGLLLAAGAVATWRQVRISREGQVTERFTRAVDQLGSGHLEVRLGGLYALERIARDSLGDRRTVAEVLTAYIRQRAPWQDNQQAQPADPRGPAADVQAALTILGRGPFPKPVGQPREGEPLPARLDLSLVDLRYADLIDAHLEGALFVGTNLDHAQLQSAHMRGTQFNNARLEGAHLNRAHLEDAWFLDANLQETEPDLAYLEGALVNGGTVWPKGFDWHSTGAKLFERWQPDRSDTAAEPAEPGTAEPPAATTVPPDAVPNGTDEADEPG